jgi:hypothetical protein
LTAAVWTRPPRLLTAEPFSATNREPFRHRLITSRRGDSSRQDDLVVELRYFLRLTAQLHTNLRRFRYFSWANKPT